MIDLNHLDDLARRLSDLVPPVCVNRARSCRPPSRPRCRRVCRGWIWSPARNSMCSARCCWKPGRNWKRWKPASPRWNSAARRT